MDSAKVLETQKMAVAFIPTADVAYGGPDSDYINMSKGQVATLLLAVKSSGGSMTLTLKNATDAAGASAAAIAGRYRKVNRAGSPIDTLGAYTDFTSSGFSIAANSDGIYAVEVRAEDLTATKPFICAHLAQGTAGAIIGAGIWCLGGARYSGPVAPSIVS